MKKSEKGSGQIADIVVNNMNNNESEELINLLEECKISNGVVMLTMLGIGTHTEYYKVLINRINNSFNQVNDNWVKQQALEIFHDIDESNK